MICWPGLPIRTSWWASNPANRIAWTLMPDTAAPLAWSGSCSVASGEGPTSADWRAAAIISAVRTAVPDGASPLLGCCISMISTESKYGAASAAKRVAKTEPIEKFGAINTPTLGWSANWFCKAWRLSSLQPEVPTTTWRLFLTANSTICGDTVGTVRSKTWVAPEDRMLSSESCDASSATSSRSSDELMAALAYCPILPVAPTRATLIGSDVVAGCVDMGLILLDTQSGCSCCAKDETAGPNA